MILTEGKLLALEASGESASGTLVRKWVLHGRSALIIGLARGTFLQVAARGGVSVRTLTGRDVLDEGQKGRYFIYNEDQFALESFKGLCEILAVGYNDGALDAAIADNSLVLGKTPILHPGVHTLGGRSLWFDALITRIQFEALMAASSQPRCVEFLEKQIINEVFNVLFSQDEMRPKRTSAGLVNSVPREDPNVERARLWCESRVFGKPQLGELCDALGISKNTLNRCFQRAHGCSLLSFHHSFKMAKAQSLLTETSLSVLDVAMSLGYSDAVAFRHAFKSFHGRSPRSSC